MVARADKDGMGQILSLMLISFLLTACGKDSASPVRSVEQKQNVSAIYTAHELKLKVFYEEGAEPFAGGLGELKLWNLLETNLKALFQGRKTLPQITVPKELSEMTKLAPHDRVSWTVNQVLELHQKTALPEAENRQSFHIYFLKGRAVEGSQVIGYHISNTRVLVIFKDTIMQSSTELDLLVPRYVEQATLIHEMGHALGLVNNGLPMVNDHHDHQHRAHCNNPECVMYYANEGANGMVKFVGRILGNLSAVMFDQKCLNDARAYKD